MAWTWTLLSERFFFLSWAVFSPGRKIDFGGLGMWLNRWMLAYYGWALLLLKLGTVVSTCNPIAGDVKAEPNHSYLCGQYKSSLGNMRPCLKSKRKTRKELIDNNLLIDHKFFWLKFKVILVSKIEIFFFLNIELGRYRCRENELLDLNGFLGGSRKVWQRQRNYLKVYSRSKLL